LALLNSLILLHLIHVEQRKCFVTRSSLFTQPGNCVRFVRLNTRQLKLNLLQPLLKHLKFSDLLSQLSWLLQPKISSIFVPKLGDARLQRVTLSLIYAFRKEIGEINLKQMGY
jgi:hypothetical protein